MCFLISVFLKTKNPQKKSGHHSTEYTQEATSFSPDCGKKASVLALLGLKVSTTGPSVRLLVAGTSSWSASTDV